MRRKPTAIEQFLDNLFFPFRFLLTFSLVLALLIALLPFLLMILAVLGILAKACLRTWVGPGFFLLVLQTLPRLQHPFLALLDGFLGAAALCGVVSAIEWGGRVAREVKIGLEEMGDNLPDREDPLNRPYWFLKDLIEQAKEENPDEPESPDPVSAEEDPQPDSPDASAFPEESSPQDAGPTDHPESSDPEGSQGTPS